MRVMESDDDAEYARFETLARTLVNTPKPSAPVRSAGEPADDGAEREEAGSDDD